jgi:hypothetical protein
MELKLIRQRRFTILSTLMIIVVILCVCRGVRGGDVVPCRSQDLKRVVKTVGHLSSPT